MTGKKYAIISLSITMFILISLALLVIIIDPYFHYHKPLNNITYILDNQRYQNNGIVKHFDYDAIITGTSMTENFKTSELDNLFNVNSIKVSFSGANFKEINDILLVATENNNKIKMVIRCLDLYKINLNKDELSYDSNLYPTYLYDKSVFNDIKYVLNKNIITNSIELIIESLKGKASTSFDDYSSWYKIVNFAKETVDSQYIRSEKKQLVLTTEEDYKTVNDNITQNVINIAKEYPNIDFYLFYPPYSIYYWDNLNQLGTINKQLDVIESVSEMLINYPNIHLYNFLDEYDIITNLNNYKDVEHYSDKINSTILTKMKNNENIITKDNYKKKSKEIRDFYLNYNYEKLFQK